MTKQINQYIDHTLLKPTAVAYEFQKLCDEAKTHQFFSVCVPPTWIKFCKTELSKTNLKVVTVVGFPWGYSLTETKVAETAHCVALGADEIDMVLNQSWLKSGLIDLVAKDITAVVSAASRLPVKVILEISELTLAEIKLVCEIAKNSGAKFVKTSTGFSKSGATEEVVGIMRAAVGEDFGVKASGGISNQKTAQKMIAAGANRLGCSKSVDIVLGNTSSVGGSY